MVKEYIENLILDTNEELERLQTQMKELLEELQSSQENQERLQREKNRDTNIFSPRSIQLGTDEKLAKAKEEVKKIDQEVEYIREKIESSAKKKEEYMNLLAEIEGKNEFEKEDSGETEENEKKAFAEADNLKKSAENSRINNFGNASAEEKVCITTEKDEIKEEKAEDTYKKENIALQNTERVEKRNIEETVRINIEKGLENIIRTNIGDNTENIRESDTEKKEYYTQKKTEENRKNDLKSCKDKMADENVCSVEEKNIISKSKRRENSSEHEIESGSENSSENSFENSSENSINRAEKHTENAKIKHFLQKLYKRTEICLACVNSDKNRCKNELKAMKNEIKKYASAIEGE